LDGFPNTGLGHEALYPNVGDHMEVTPDSLSDHDVSVEVSHDGVLSHEDVINGAAENVFEQKPVMRFPWGTLDLVYDDHGNSAGFVSNFREALSPRIRVEAVQRAATKVLAPNYNSVIEESIRSDASQFLDQSAVESSVAEALPDATAQVRELAFRIDALRQAFDHVRSHSREWYQLRTELRSAVRPYQTFSGKFMVGGRMIPTSVINSNIIP
jgi:hypothetical protein